MAIQDADAERRNLVVTSIAFIAYYLGEGQIEQEVLKLPLINIHFYNIQALVAMLWVALLWFLFRYWLTHKRKFKNTLDSELSPLGKLNVIRKYFEARTKITLSNTYTVSTGKELDYHIDKICYRIPEGIYSIMYSANATIRKPKLARTTSKEYNIMFECLLTGDSVHQGFVNLSGVRGNFTLFLCVLKCCVSQPSFSSYVVPYLLCITAIALGSHDLINLVSSFFSNAEEAFIC